MEHDNVYSNLMHTNIENRELSGLLWDGIADCSEKKMKKWKCRDLSLTQNLPVNLVGSWNAFQERGWILYD